MDDVVVKTRQASTLIDDLCETFKNLQAYNIKLNPEKRVFGVPSGKLLGFIVSHRGIEVNPDKIRALARLKEHAELRYIQHLAECIASLSRFISHHSEKALPLYRLLKQTWKFKWTTEANAALEEIKTLLASNPVLATPFPGEPMLLYISATNQVVSAILVVERDMEGHKLKVQRPEYYVFEVLTPCKTRYPHYQRIAYTVFMASQKLRHYFQECSITVALEVPLNDIINNQDATGESQSGPSSSSLLRSYIGHVGLLNPRCWPILSLNG